MTMSRKLYLLRTFVATFVLLFSALTLRAADSSMQTADSPLRVADKATADSLYAAKQYAEAVELYTVLSDSLESSEIYYNLGCAEYKQKHYARAILAYERALRIDPDNADAQYNITLVRTRIADRFADPSEMFFISWLRTWVTSHSVSHWTGWSFGWIVAFFAGMILYFLGRRMWQRKVGFFFAIFCALAFLLTTIFAIVQRVAFAGNSDAVIMAEEVKLYTSPSTSSKQVRTIHEGTTVTVLELQGKDWTLVELPDATEAWLPGRPYEFVVKTGH